MSEVTPLRDDDPELAAVKDLLRQGRRKLAWRLLAAGLALGIAGGIAFWRMGSARAATGDDAASGTMVGILYAAAGLACAIGLGLVGTAVFVLIRTRSGRTEQDT